MRAATSRRSTASKGETRWPSWSSQFYMLELSAEEEDARLWAEDELRAIRETEHEGPLHDVSGRTVELSERIAEREIGETTQSGQRGVEDILDKVARLIEEQAKRNPMDLQLQQLTMSQRQQAQQQRQARQRRRGQRQQGQQGQQQRQNGQRQQGEQMAQRQQPGDKQDPKPGENPAEDSRLRRGDMGKEKLGDKKNGNDAWGKINDRDVAKSLREAWAKIPPQYRDKVIWYFEDITDVSGAKKPEGGEK